jgi:hypothetical protein
MEIQRLERFIRENPALADVPFIVVKGKPMSPKEALESLHAGILTEEISVAVQATLGSPEMTLEELWMLTEEYYRRMMEIPRELWPKIIWIGGEMNYEEAYREVKDRTPRGREIVEGYRALLAEMRRRLHG